MVLRNANFCDREKKRSRGKSRMESGLKKEPNENDKGVCHQAGKNALG